MTPRSLFNLVLGLSLVVAYVSCRAVNENVRAKRQAPANRNGTCNQVLTSQNGSFSSPGYNQSYPSNQDCVTTIVGPNRNYTIDIIFSVFDVEANSGCAFDYLQITYNNNTTDKMCGDSMRNTSIELNVNGGNVSALFHSDGSVQGAGFMATYSIRPAPTPAPRNESCNQVLTSQNGSFSSPGYNQSYPSNQDCVTTIVGPNRNYTIDITFSVFDVEANSGCAFDYLQITYNNNTTDKMCGGSMTNTSIELNVNGGNVSALFHSDGSVQGAGFMATYSIRPAPTPAPRNESCNQVLTSQNGSFSSPGYNQSYPSNQDCVTTIVGPNRNYTIDITFSVFEVEGTGNCPFDYLQITYNNNVTDKMCGGSMTNTSIELNVNGGNVSALFHSDGSVQGAGFMATYSIRPAPTPAPRNESCNQVLTSQNGSFSSPGYNQSYPSNQDCITTIVGPNRNYTIDITFSVFDVEANSGCAFDYLQITYNNNTTDKMCGGSMRNTSIELNVNGGNVSALFHSDGSVQGAGFMATYSIRPAPTPVPTPAPRNESCNQVLTSQNGSFSSPGYNQSYPSNKDCVTTIVGPNRNYTIDITFSVFDVEANSACGFDYLQITYNNNQTDKMCGGSMTNTSIALNVNGGNVSALFHSDGSVQGAGFMATYSIRPAPTPAPISYNQTLTGPSDSFLSPAGSNQSYPDNVDAFTTIVGPDMDYTLEIRFHDFDIEAASNCQYDYLQVISPANQTDKMCGDSMQGDSIELEVSGGNVSLLFHSDYAVSGRGFQATYFIKTRVPSIRDPCEWRAQGSSGWLESLPGTGEDYSSYTDCRYIFQVPANHHLVLDFTTFNLEAGNTCQFDYIQIDDGPKYCGSETPHMTVDTVGEVVMRFSTDFSVVERGFVAQYRILTGNETAGNTTFAPAPTNMTYMPTNMTYAPTNMTYMPTNMTYMPTNMTYMPTNMTYAPTNMTYMPTNMTYAPTNMTYMPTNMTYAPTNMTFMPTNMTYAPTNMTYMPTNMTYAPTNMTYAPTNMTYAPTNMTYAPTNMTYMPTNMTYAPTNMTFMPTNMTYAPTNMTYMPTNMTFMPTNMTYAPTNMTFMPINSTYLTTSVPGSCDYTGESLEGSYSLVVDQDGFYANGLQCTINLYSEPLPHVTTITFTRFDVEHADDCGHDFLMIEAGVGQPDMLCGNNRGSFVKQYTTHQPDLMMMFHSDVNTVGQGFQFTYKTEMVYCNATIDSVFGAFSANPNGYDNNMDCTYTINTPSAMDLKIIVLYMDIEQETNCLYDALTIAGEKLCGQSQGEERIVHSDGSFEITFTSDGSQVGGGFYLIFEPADVVMG